MPLRWTGGVCFLSGGRGGSPRTPPFYTHGAFSDVGGTVHIQTKVVRFSKVRGRSVFLKFAIFGYIKKRECEGRDWGEGIEIVSRVKQHQDYTKGRRIFQKKRGLMSHKYPFFVTETRLQSGNGRTDNRTLPEITRDNRRQLYKRIETIRPYNLHTNVFSHSFLVGRWLCL